ncbi:TPA: hypothetical protein I9007_000877 [Clostridium perfringens]|uniref:hypothetical protein n=1 Tax=Clostridium perfringens TaxID=1502 RepID=UPI001A2367D8|nr:hypothetical protein [Clostridium perfringens]WFB45904.1 hypothetical protein P6X90_05800 [Clostridium perfringens]WFD77473.1 hypothetical protein P6978_05800 [Clostridium perfringens]WFD86029.1 hypothetical protein P7C31_05860 [Clostridium perfringens]WFD98841.1 hypothetical protein P7D00_05855 [Clostridium perfringens]HAT4185390.1 hypothetical protein [Clostridium perfringens]
MLKLDSRNNFLIYSTEDASENVSIKNILEHMLIEFDLIFTKSLTTLEPCYISKNYALGYPILITNEDNLRISLAVDSYRKWNQTVYQLSHELCHYILNQTSNGKKILKWFEETLCEAMSLYILDFFYETWSDCKLSHNDIEYKQNFKTYLDDILEKTPTNGLKNCKTIDDLFIINFNSERDRSDRISERNYLFELFKSNKDQKEKMALIKDYQKYISSNGLTIDFAKWYEDTGEEFIQKLSEIQPI